MRQLLVVSLIVAGCGRIRPPAEETPGGAPDGLYSDAEVRALARHDIDQTSHTARHLFDVPCLEVVPNGESKPREAVFRALGLDDGRLREFRLGGLNQVNFLWWRVSTSYDIVCMTAINDTTNDGFIPTDPSRKVFGIRLVARSRKFYP
ncbi:MAG: hypothetical protein U0804_23715 [Gemmataceae bacterium]